MKDIPTIINIVIAGSTFCATFINALMYCKTDKKITQAKFDNLIIIFIESIKKTSDIAKQYWCIESTVIANDPIKTMAIYNIKSQTKELDRCLKIINDCYKKKISNIDHVGELLEDYKEAISGWESETIFISNKTKHTEIDNTANKLLNILYIYQYK